MKTLLIAAAVTAGLACSATPADAQYRYYNAPRVYVAPSYGYSNQIVPSYYNYNGVITSGYVTPSYYNSGIVTTGYTPTIYPSVYTPYSYGTYGTYSSYYGSTYRGYGGYRGFGRRW